MGSIIGGAAQVAGSVIGGRARRREEKDARAQHQGNLDRVNNFQFQNEFANLENTAEDLTVNNQAANFQAQQNDQGLAQGLDAVVASGGGGGGAQAIANAALQSKQGLSNSLAQQEQGNQQLRLQQAGQNQRLEAQGAGQLQAQQYAHAGDTLDLSNNRLNAAQDARTQATAGLTQGLGSIVGGVATGGLGELAGAAKGLFG